jgi:hypothetical protein
VNDFTYRHPWWAAFFSGLAIFVVVLLVAVTMMEVPTPATYAALIASLIAITVGIAWRGGVDS